MTLANFYPPLDLIRRKIMRPLNRLLMILAIGVLLGACTAPDVTPTPTVPPQPADVTTPPVAPSVLSLMTHDSFAVSEELIRAFELENNVTIHVILSGDTGAALNRAILTQAAPIADVFYGVDNTFLSRALDAGIFSPYDSPLLDSIPDEFKLDPENRSLPVDYGDVCINYDKIFFEERNLPIPQSLEDLTQPEYEGLLVVQNPATSSPGLAFLLATIAHFGPDQYLGYWEALQANGVVVVSDWETAYYTNFSGSSGRGPQPMVVSYGSSPAAEVVFAPEPLDEAPTASIVGPDACFRQIEFVGILEGTQNREMAERFVDYMLSVPFQEDLPLQMFVFPVNSEAQLPDVFLEHIQIADQPARMDYREIGQNRETWIQDWMDVVLR
jgi:thiamine transport system substrate-binding protein